MENILVDVIVPVFNASNYLDETIVSLLNQTHNKLNIIFIDDGSTDNSLNIIKKHSENDCRIRILHRENRGLIVTLNELIKISKAKFIVRMDADDICELNRIEIQLNYLLNNRDVAVVGSRVKIIDDNGFFIRNNYTYYNSDEIRFSMYFGNPIVHPSTMFNLNVLNKDDFYYDINFKYIEDFELWFRLANKYKLVNINKKLLKYRESVSGVSRTQHTNQKIASIGLLSKNVDSVDFRYVHIANRFSFKWIANAIKLLRKDGYKLSYMKVIFIEMLKTIVRK